MMKVAALAAMVAQAAAQKSVGGDYVGAPCSTSCQIMPCSTGCAAPLTCLVTDPGFSAADRPNSGMCVMASGVSPVVPPPHPPAPPAASGCQTDADCTGFCRPTTYQYDGAKECVAFSPAGSCKYTRNRSPTMTSGRPSGVTAT